MPDDLTELSDVQLFDQLLSDFFEPAAWARQRAGVAWVSAGIASFVCSLGNFLLPLPDSLHLTLLWAGVIIGFFCVATGTEANLRKDINILKQFLAQTQDTRLISRLVALASGYWAPGQIGKSNATLAKESLHGDAVAALTRLLPTIRPEDAQMLTYLQRQWLYEQLQGYDAPLILAILQATVRCGSVQALPYVEPLAKGKGAARRHPAIRELAQSCAQQLRDRLERLNASQTLLRGGMAPATEILLRPGVAPIAEDLLRPGAPPDFGELLRTGRIPTDLLLPVMEPSDPAPHLLLHPAETTADPDPRQLLKPASETAETLLVQANVPPG